MGVDCDVALAQNEEWILEEVEHALQRIEDGTFGRCQDCGREIDRDRLDALPYTRYCIRCSPRHEPAQMNQ
jgi:DnaK suppressor protein